MKRKYQLKIALLWLAIIAFIAFLCGFWYLIDVLKTNNSDMISEDTAISIAQNAVQEKLSEENLDYDIFADQTEILVEPSDDDLYYVVAVPTGYVDTNEQMETYHVQVDFYGGAVRQLEASQ